MEFIKTVNEITATVMLGHWLHVNMLFCYKSLAQPKNKQL